MVDGGYSLVMQTGRLNRQDNGEDGDGDADELMILHGIGVDAKTSDVWKYLQ